MNGISDYYTACITVGSHFQLIRNCCFIRIAVPVGNTAGFPDVDIRSVIYFDRDVCLTVDLMLVPLFVEYTGHTD